MSASDHDELRFVSIPATFSLRGDPLVADRGVLRAVDARSGRHVALRRFGALPTESMLKLRRVRGRGLRPFQEVLRDEGGPYAIADLGEGTIGERLARGPLTESALVGAAFDLGHALHTLHQAGYLRVDPCAGSVIVAADGSLAMLTLCVDPDAGLHATEDPIASDLVALGRLLLRCAGASGEGEDSWNEAPEALRPILRRLLTAGSVSGYDDTNQLLTDLRARLEDDRADASRGDGDTLFDTTDGAVIDLAESDVPDTRSAPPRLPSELPTRGSQTPTAAKSASAGSRSKSQIDPFPWRPIADLYDIVGEAGSGGMGAVQVAVEKSTRRKVAVKRLKDVAGLSQSALDRFYREAHAIANLSHPHILQLLQPGQDEEGDYLVLEWAAGGSLKDRLTKHGPLPEEEVVAIARKIGAALAYAHQKGVIHRDLKPHNILLDETGEPKLADFGLARSVDDLTLSTSHAAAGSPLYMAPEQHNASRDANARSDLYSFGKTLYQLATGKLPNSPDPRLLPPSLRGPILHCMEEEPERRPESAAAFLKELERSTRPAASRLSVIAALLLASVAGVYVWRTQFGNDPSNPYGTDSDPTITRNHAVTASFTPILQPLLALVGSKEEPVANGATASQEVILRVDLGATDTKVELADVIVERNGVALPAADVRLERDGREIRAIVKLAPGNNEFRVRIGGFEPVATRVDRVFPKPRVEGAEGATKLGDSYVSAGESIRVRGVVAEAQGVDALELESASGERIAVPVVDGAFVVDVPLSGDSETAREYSWRLTDTRGRDRLDAPKLRLAADRAPPMLSLLEPTAALVRNAKSAEFRVRGTIQETHRDPNARVQLSLERVHDGSSEALPEWTRELAVTTSNDATLGVFEEVMPLPTGVQEGDLVMHARYRDAAGREAASTVAFRIDVKPPHIANAEGRPAIRADKRDDGTFTIGVSAEADEPLQRAWVNKLAANVEGASFELSGLAPAEVYEIVLEDLAGNTSEPFAFSQRFDFDLTAPTISGLFGVDDGGRTLLKITANEAISMLEVSGAVSITSEGDVWTAILVPPLQDLRDPRWGPSQSPFVVSAMDAAGNRTERTWVCAPPIYGRDPYGPIAIPLATRSDAGIYCPNAANHPNAATREGFKVDWFIDQPGGRCGECGRNVP